jgi:L-threonylcarbamoyladenylate synthase
MASDFCIRHAAHIIRHGGVIAYPTDTIYGLGCDPYNQDAIARLNHIKQRDPDKQFILLAGSIEQVKPLLVLDAAQEKTIVQNTESTSWIISASSKAPGWLTGDQHTIAIRITSNHDVCRLCSMLGHAIVSTSANLSGRPPANSPLQLHQQFHHKVDKILVADKQPTAKASKIIRLSDGRVIRD